MILENGVIRTMDPTMPVVVALAIAGERIAGGVGTHEQALASPDHVNLDGRCVLPGFSDAHVHFPTWALAQREVRLEDTTSLDEALALVEGAVGTLEPGRWLRGRGWRSGDWSPEVEPTRQALDAVTGDTPVALMARDYHSLWLNSAALAAADGDLQVTGGVVELDENGEPTGVLREESAWRFRDRYLTASDDEFVDAMREGLRIVAAPGRDRRPRQGRLARRSPFLAAAGRGRRAHLARLAVASLRPRRAAGGDRLPLGDRRRPAANRLPQGLHGRNARLTDGTHARRIRRRDHEPGSPRRDHSCRGSGRLAGRVHAIGDLANREALDAFEETRDDWEPLGLRQRIEHAQLLAPEDIPRFGELGVAASVQFSHAPSDRDIADRNWAGKTEGAYAYRSLLDSGAVVANGSDAPIEELDPLAGIRAGVLRTLDEREAWHPEQALTVEQALEATIVAPAWLARDERRRGKLLPGYLADLVVLDRDPLAIDAEELPEIEVVATMLGGRWIHNPPPWD